MSLGALWVGLSISKRMTAPGPWGLLECRRQHVRGSQRSMLKNLSTSTKLIILCGMFILSIAVTTHSLVAERRIAIDFARKELLGDRYLAILRNVYAVI